MKRILVVNDDGLRAPGLPPLIKALSRLGKVTAVVPEHERSTMSHALTLHKPLRLHEASRGLYGLSGTPADCARFGVLHLLRDRVDLVVSGINAGYNLGEDVFYSGTVGAALEATILDVPSLAVSQQAAGPVSFEPAARLAARVAKAALTHGAGARLCLNLNVPDRPFKAIKGVRLASLGQRLYPRTISARKDPRGRHYYWMTGRKVSGVARPGSDIAAVDEGWASLTPLLCDMTDAGGLEILRRWRL